MNKLLSIITCILFLSSCEYAKLDFGSPKVDEGHTSSPSAPETGILGISIGLVSLTPSFEKRPQISVSGLKIGDSIRVYSDDECSIPLSLNYSASSANENIQLNSDPNNGDQFLYVQISRGSLKT